MHVSILESVFPDQPHHKKEGLRIESSSSDDERSSRLRSVRCLSWKMNDVIHFVLYFS